MREVFVTMQNADLTEGRGPMRPVAYFDDEASAVRCAQGRGVMGVGHGEVHAQTIFADWDEWEAFAGEDVNSLRGLVSSRLIWGNRKNWADKWDQGYIDQRDRPTNDPEWATYVRLRRKFSGEES